MGKKNKKKNNNLKIFLIVLILIILVGLIIYAKNFRDFSNVTLMKNNKEYYNIKDLVIGDIKYLDKEKRVEDVFGKPNKEYTKVKNNYLYKIKEYDGLTITLKEDYSDFIVVKIEVTSKKYKTGRNIKVGNKITKVMKKYKIENKNGKYMYGNYSRKALKDKAIKKEIYMGYREKNKVEYIVRDAVVDKNNPVMISRVKYEYKYGKVKKITWSYDIE